MTTVNSSYSIPSSEYTRLEGFFDECEKIIEGLNMTEIVRVAIHDLISEKKPKDISIILNSIGRKRRGRPKKIKESEEAEKINKTVETDFSKISDFQWEKIESLFSGDEGARQILSDILFHLQNAWKRGVSKRTTPTVKRWRQLQKWQENGIWTEVYKQMLPTFDKKQINAWNEIFLKSFLLKRNRDK